MLSFPIHHYFYFLFMYIAVEEMYKENNEETTTDGGSLPPSSPSVSDSANRSILLQESPQNTQAIHPSSQVFIFRLLFVVLCLRGNAILFQVF